MQNERSTFGVTSLTTHEVILLTFVLIHGENNIDPWNTTVSVTLDDQSCLFSYNTD